MENIVPLKITVVRLGHRVDRDKRMTSHLGLTARAFGADRVILSGDKDDTPLETWRSVTSRFGGEFECMYEPKPMRWLRAFSKSGGKIVHLTMYGRSWNEMTPDLPSGGEIAIVVGGTKVPGELFGLADYNIAIGNQPHSEVAALAVFLNAYVGPKGPDHFPGGSVSVMPSADGKILVSKED
ncbi:MAG: hypothetical protein L7R66_00540 [Candidatus Thalassarchaeaceae archaeon]|nr:hypothetical protein [Candidatus Thalassarchaeaceae archaeon]|tara:strand:+ start:2569 stop:3114 length:546 start_codon:yes stop_codon:yes gene_type:complete